MKAKKIAVVGAGLSGVVCALRLQKYHFIRVFQKSRGVGGRVSTRRGEGWQADHGAQYFTVKQAVFQEEVKIWMKKGWVAQWNNIPQAWKGSEWIKTEGSVKRFVGTPKMKQPIHQLSKDLKIDLSAQVIELAQKESKGFEIILKEGKVDDIFDMVILAMPSQQALKLVKPHSTKLSTICAQAELKPCFAAIAIFDKPLELPFQMGFVNENKLLSWVAKDSSKPGRSGQVWVLHASSQYSAINLQRPSEEVLQELIKQFVRIGGRRPQEAYIHRWKYAFNASKNEQIGYGFDKEIGLCGDWLYGGRIEGAYLSGIKLANKLLQQM